MKKYFTLVLIPLLFLSSSSLCGQIFLFDEYIYPTDVNDDGTVIVGTWKGVPSKYFIWDDINGVGLIDCGTPFASRPSVSGDGLWVAGNANNPLYDWYEMSLYNVLTHEITLLGSFGISPPGLDLVSAAHDISTDGSTVVGYSYFNSEDTHAVKWTYEEGFIDLGESGYASVAFSTNENGELIGGYQIPEFGSQEAVIWENNIKNLITFSNGDPAHIAETISSEGSWIGGAGNSPEHTKAWKWNKAVGMLEIGPEPPNNSGKTKSFSADGNLGVGIYIQNPGAENRAFIYSDQTGFVDLNTYAESLGIDTQGIQFGSTIHDFPPEGICISDDGSTVAGVTHDNRGFIFRLSGNQINNTCVGSIVTECGKEYSGNTVNASNTGGNESNDVYYSYTGHGEPELVTLSLCNVQTNYNSIVRVYDDCNLINQIAVNDDACGLQSHLTFSSDGNTTYYVLIEGAGTATGNYKLEVTCETSLFIGEHPLNQLIFFPNPVSKELNIEAPTIITSINVSTLEGKSVLHSYPENNIVKIDMGELSPGLYLVGITTESGRKTIKVIKKL